LVKEADIKGKLIPRENQLDAVEKYQDSPDGVLLYHSTGTGKTVSSLLAKETDPDATAGVLVPAALRENYRKAVNQVTTDPENYDIRSYDSAAAGDVPPQMDVLIADEVQRLRNQGKSYEGTLQAAAKAKKRILLSGTPLVNAPGDMASIINLLHGQQIYTPEEFEKRFATEKVHGPFLGIFGKGGLTTNVAHRRELDKLLEGRVSYAGEEGSTKPTVTEASVPVEMSPEQDKLYRLLEEKLPFWSRWAVRHNLPVEKQQSPQLNAFLSGMRQVSLSPYGFNRRLAPYDAFRQSPKLQQTFQTIQEELAKPKGKAMVYTNFPTAGFTPLAAALDKAKIPYVQFDGSLSDEQRKKAVNDYNYGRVRVVLVSPAGAEGISLKGTSKVSILDPHWNEARTDQAEGRAVRMDSHTYLPENLRNVAIDHYQSYPRRSLLGRWLGMQGRTGSDQYIESRSAERQKQLEQFLDVLREAGTR